jgi:MSHA biogenesis protein MshI
LLALLRRTNRKGWHVGIVPAERETALAIVRTTRSGRRQLRHCAVHPAIEIRAEHVLAPLNHGGDLAHAPVSAVLSAQDYQLVQIEAPEVEPGELKSAVRWKLRDLINFSVTDAVIDVIEIPEHARYVETRMVFAVAARAEAVRRIVDLVKPRARGFDVIDIPELCLRNVCALLPQDEQGVALLALGEGFAQLVLTCGRTLYLARRIELPRRMETLTPDGGGDVQSDMRALAVELQRSLDYYESHYDQPPIGDLVIASGDERAARLLGPLREETGLNTELFDVRAFFEVAPGIEPDTHFPGLVALGAALRTDRGDA